MTYESQLLQKQSREKTGLKSIEWAAGLFEGEGCISYREDQNRYCLCIAMCDGDVGQMEVNTVTLSMEGLTEDEYTN